MTAVAVIGPGRVGTALALGLAHAGYGVVAVTGRSEDGVAQFRERLPEAEPRGLDTVGRDADLVLVTVPDDVLAGVVRTAAAGAGVRESSRWVHTAGGYGTEVLAPAQLAGAAVAACHPAQTFPDPDRGFAALPGTTWAVTAEAADLGWARVLITDLRGSPVTVPARNRTLYHAGLAVGSNATASVVTLARDLLLGAGVGDPAAFLGPLVTTTAGNAVAHGAAALTGPVRRGDAGTVARHLQELRAVMPEAVEAYLALARLALAQARRAGLDDEHVAALDEVLQ